MAQASSTISAIECDETAGYQELPAQASEQQLAAAFAAMANAKGGVVVVGPYGLEEVAAAEGKVKRALATCEPPLLGLAVHVLEIGETRHVRVSIPAGLPDVYSVDGRYWIRQGKRNRVLSGKPLKQLFLERHALSDGHTSFESQPVPNASLDDLNWGKVQEYLRYSNRAASPEVDSLSRDDLVRILYQLGCLIRVENGFQPNYACILLFGLAPYQFLPSSEVILVRYAGPEMGDEFLRENVRGTLPEQARRAETFLVSNMRRGSRLIGWQREEQLEYPVSAVREAVINALAHRDYSIQGEGVRVIMFSDRIEVYSPGRLPGHVTLDNIVEERYSRNPIVVQTLVDLGFIESLGYGIDRMIQAMEEANLPPPLFEETANGFRVTLRGQGEDLVSNGADPSRWVHLHLNERQVMALNYLTEHDRLTNRAYQDLCPDVSPETLRRDLAELVRRGLLLKIGDKKATYYIIK